MVRQVNRAPKTHDVHLPLRRLHGDVFSLRQQPAVRLAVHGLRTECRREEIAAIFRFSTGADALEAGVRLHTVLVDAQLDQNVLLDRLGLGLGLACESVG